MLRLKDGSSSAEVETLSLEMYQLPDDGSKRVLLLGRG
jgi:hypothetical protein